MARVKNDFKLLEDINIDTEEQIAEERDAVQANPTSTQKKPQKAVVKSSKPASKKSNTTNKSNNKKSYEELIANPVLGNQGGRIGHPPVPDAQKKKPVSFYCNEEEKQLYQAAAAKDGRRFPDFVNRAIKEYINNHNLG